MRSSIALVALVAAFAPATLAVTINGDGITWAPGEECSQECTFKQFSASTCPLDTPFEQAQTCACSSGDLVQKVDACIKATCPDQYEALKPELDAACVVPTSTESSAPGQTGIPEVTIGEACGLYCNFQALEDADKIDNCPVINQDNNACVCASSAYATRYEQCARDVCGSAADNIIAHIRDDCPAGSTPPPATGGPSRTTTPPAQSSATGGPQASQPGDAGAHAAAMSLSAVVVALAAFVGLA